MPAVKQGERECTETAIGKIETETAIGSFGHAINLVSILLINS